MEHDIITLLVWIEKLENKISKLESEIDNIKKLRNYDTNGRSGI